MKFIKHVILIFSLMFLSSCGGTLANHFKLKQKLPFDSFVKVVATYDVVKCIGETCMKFKFGATSSGSVVRTYPHGSYILTTGHSCDPKAIMYDLGGGLKIKQTTYLIDINGVKHNTKTININNKLDTCILYSSSVSRAPVRVERNDAPEWGDKIYNMAAPVGMFNTRTVPILEGRYSGHKWGFSLYTVPAIGGSSGSPLFNHRGKLVGMIHSVHTRFHHLSFGPTHAELVNYIYKHTPFHVPEGVVLEVDGTKGSNPSGTKNHLLDIKMR
jgi:S1-C subfamily serine protease